MASEKKTSKNAAYDRLRAALKAQTTARAYLFYGEESYLRQTYVQQLQTLLIPKGSEDFNLHRLSGPRLTAQEVADAVEAMPMMAANTLVTVTDWDIFKLEEAQRSQLIELLEDIPEYCTLLFIYDTVAYKRDGKMKKLAAAIDKNVEVVEFQGQSRDALVRWLQKRFRALDHQIDLTTADYMLFYCGSMMDNLIGEVNKVAAYAKAEQITTDFRHDQPHLRREIRPGRRRAGRPAADADGAHCHSGGHRQGAAPALHRPHGHRRRQGPLLAHGAVADAQRLPGKAPAAGGPECGPRVVQAFPHRLPGAGSAHEKREEHRPRGRADKIRTGAGTKMSKQRIQEVIVVEGRYDKNILSQVVDATIVETGGFSVFNDREKLAFLRTLAQKRGIILLTDSDGAGFVIRNYLKGALPRDRVKQAYIPDIPGKERRKRKAGKEGKLGVEGMTPEILLEALRRSGATFGGETLSPPPAPITKADLLERGLIGPGSVARRQTLLKELSLPAHLTPTPCWRL